MQSEQHEFYYGVDGERYGPVSFDELKRLLSEGRVRPQDFLWAEETQDWVPVDQMPDLMAHVPAASLVPGGFFLRLLAYILDGCALWIVSTLVIGGETLLRYGDIVYGEGLLSSRPYSAEELSLVVRVNMILLFIEVLYRSTLESSPWQATLGKRLLGLKVVDGDGQRISFGRAVVRFAGHVVSRLTLMVGYLMVAFTERKQGLHDKIADTYVVRR